MNTEKYMENSIIRYAWAYHVICNVNVHNIVVFPFN